MGRDGASCEAIGNGDGWIVGIGDEIVELVSFHLGVNIDAVEAAHGFCAAGGEMLLPECWHFRWAFLVAERLCTTEHGECVFLFNAIFHVSSTFQ